MFHNVIDEKVTEHGRQQGRARGGGANADVICSCLVKYPIFFDRAFGAHIKYNFASARKRIFLLIYIRCISSWQKFPKISFNYGPRE